MKARWREEPAAHGNAIWFVGIEDDRLSVLAPPGVPVTRRKEAETDLLYGTSGWRWAVWVRDGADHWPVIDDEAPDAMCEIDADGVLSLLPGVLHDRIWSCMWHQLQIAVVFGRQEGNRVPSEVLARAGAISVTWLSNEILRAFPECTDLIALPGPADDLPFHAPDDPSELIQESDRVRATPQLLDPAAPLAYLVLYWLSSKLGLQRRSRWKALLAHRAGNHEPPETSDYSWASERTAGEVLETEELAPS